MFDEAVRWMIRRAKEAEAKNYSLRGNYKIYFVEFTLRSRHMSMTGRDGIKLSVGTFRQNAAFGL